MGWQSGLVVRPPLLGDTMRKPQRRARRTYDLWGAIPCNVDQSQPATLAWSRRSSMHCTKYRVAALSVDSTYIPPAAHGGNEGIRA